MAVERELGVNLWTLTGWEPRSFVLNDEAFARLAAAGASRIELILDDGTCSFERVLAAKPELEPTLERHGLRVCGVACRHFFEHNPASESAEVRGRALRAMRNACRVASEYEAATVVVIPGMQERGVSYDATYDAAVQTLAHAARYAEDEGVTLAVENVPVDFVQSPREFVQLLDDVGFDTVKACVDVGNALAANSPFPQNWLSEIGPRVALVHAKDYVRGHGGGTRSCGDGEVPWRECFDALDRIGYDGPLVVETPPNEGEDVLLEDGLAAAGASLRWLASAQLTTTAIERT